MLSRVDRVQLVVPDRMAAVRTWEALFGAEGVAEGGSRVLNAHRTTVQAGESLFEFLEAAGPGPVREFSQRWGSGLFGVGFATENLEHMRRHLDSQGVQCVEEGGGIILAQDETYGMPTTIVQDTPRAAVGGIRYVYEVTNPVADWQDAAARYTRIFGLDPTRFSAIKSELYGYTGTLTLFDPPARLDRIEITQTFGGGAMDRFYQKRGPSLYMCYVETDDVAGLSERLREHGARFSESEDRPAQTGLFIHPSALFGMLMGVSAKDYAWEWSGRPELVPGR